MLCVYYNIFKKKKYDKAVQVQAAPVQTAAVQTAAVQTAAVQTAAVQAAPVQLHRHSHGHCLRKR